MAKTPVRLGRWLHTGWDMVGITALLMIIVECVSLGFISLVDTDPKQRDFRLDSDAYADAPWVIGYFEEDAKLRARWKPYTYWTMAPFDGRHIHIDDHGRRQTVLAAEADGPSVFMFGGSTMWGTGSRDAYTIPSQLADVLHRQCVRANVVNFGQLGYVSTQEVLALVLELREGNVPDVVVFYDGINDVTSAIHNGFPGIPHNEHRRRAEFNLLSRHRADDYNRAFVLRWINQSATVRIVRSLLHRIGPDEPVAKVAPIANRAGPELADGVSNAYVKNIEIVEMLAKRYGFTALFYLQPVIFGKHTLSPYEDMQLEAATPYREFFLSCYGAIQQQTTHVAGFRDISGILANLEEPCFLDFMHIDEKANGVVADEIARDLMAVFQTHTPQGGSEH
jgi:lysophospholipase L1-like esterase